MGCYVKLAGVGASPLAVATLARFSRRMTALTKNTHTGNTSGTHTMIPILSNSTTPRAYPKYGIQRRTIPVRSKIVEVENINTPAILIPYTFIVW